MNEAIVFKPNAGDSGIGLNCMGFPVIKQRFEGFLFEKIRFFKAGNISRIIRTNHILLPIASHSY
jgi:hypothetical protein